MSREEFAPEMFARNNIEADAHSQCANTKGIRDALCRRCGDLWLDFTDSSAPDSPFRLESDGADINTPAYLLYQRGMRAS